MTETGRDRLRELLDAVLDEEHGSLAEMAGSAYASPYHFSRQLTDMAGEPPVGLRRRVMLERANWQLSRGASVTETAFGAGYDSVEGFARAYVRAYGHPPSATPPAAPDGEATGSRHWLPAPNGVHFHPPINLWVDQRTRETTGGQLTAHLVHHDVDDTRHLLRRAGELSDASYRKARGQLTVLTFDGPEKSIADVLHRLVYTKEIWLASIDGGDFPARGGSALDELRERFEVAGSRWIAAVRDIENRGAWQDRLIDALCDPPESFVLVSVVAHVLTFSTHRRQLARHWLREAGLELDHGDPIEWLRGGPDHPDRPEQEIP